MRCFFENSVVLGPRSSWRTRGSFWFATAKTKRRRKRQTFEIEGPGPPRGRSLFDPTRFAGFTRVCRSTLLPLKMAISCSCSTSFPCSNDWGRLALGRHFRSIGEGFVAIATRENIFVCCSMRKNTVGPWSKLRAFVAVFLGLLWEKHGY